VLTLRLRTGGEGGEGREKCLGAKAVSWGGEFKHDNPSSFTLQIRIEEREGRLPDPGKRNLEKEKELARRDRTRRKKDDRLT